MALDLTTLPALFVLLLVASEVNLSKGRNFTIINDCKEIVWPGITPNNNFTGDGFALKPGQSAVFTSPPEWNGRIWGRTGCSFDGNGKGSCQTGGCGTSLKCAGPGQPPYTIADFTLGETDFYDVSVVDGFNLPLAVKPLEGKGNCSAAGCDSDLRSNCPPELAMKSDGETIACKSACNVYNTDEYCCRGMFSNSGSCLPTNYSRIFKDACPAAYSYAKDDPSSVLTCNATTDYILTFCGARNQTRCTYHDKKPICNGGNAKNAFSQIWRLLLFALPMVINMSVIS